MNRFWAIVGTVILIVMVLACNDPSASNCDKEGQTRSHNGYLEECQHTSPDPQSPLRWKRL